MESKLTKWLSYEFSTGPEAGADYLKFQREAKKELVKIAAENQMELHAFHKNHYEFSAVMKLENFYVYISIQDVRFSQNAWWNHVLYRTMKHEKDWAGGQNHYSTWNDLSKKIGQLILLSKEETL